MTMPDLHDLRRLEVKAANGDPSGRTAVRDADARHKYHDQQQDGQDIGTHGNEFLLEKMIVDETQHTHDDQSHHCVFDLADSIICAVTSFCDRPGIAGGKHHDDAHDQQGDHDEKERQIHFAVPHIALPQRKAEPHLLFCSGNFWFCHMQPPLVLLLIRSPAAVRTVRRSHRTEKM